MKIHKPVLLIILYTLLAVFPLFSLESLIGVRSGLSLPTFSGTNYDNILLNLQEKRKFKPGFTGGLLFELMFNESLSLQPELIFTMAGTRFGKSNQTETIYINFIELPVLACFKIDLEIGAIKFFGGISGSLVVGKVTRMFEPTETKIDYSSSINSLAAGLIVGGSYSLPIPTGLVFFDTRYTINFTPLYKDFGSNNTRQHNLIFSLGYAYKLNL